MWVEGTYKKKTKKKKYFLKVAQDFQLELL